ncbi:MAG TPA: hypothetical protein DCX89_00410 [Saprospirales bacterium]|nr:hypothetical protein [Saprospirales bacterium]
MNIYLYLALVLILPFSSLVISLFFNRNKTNYDLYLNLGLGYMFFNELLNLYIGVYTTLPQIPFANIYCLIFPLIIYRLFYNISNSEIFRKRIKFMAIGLMVFFIIDNLIQRDFFTNFQFHTYLVSTLILIYIVTVILLQIMKSDIIHEYLRSKSFWISLGLLLFYVPFLPVIITFEFMVVNFEIKNIITLFLIMVMNFCFIYASLWTKHR